MKDSTLDAYRAVALAKAGLGVERLGRRRFVSASDKRAL
jgi:hypothetical protein